jgi:hypothetical protein
LVIGGPAANLRYTNDDGTLRGHTSSQPFIIASNVTYSSGVLSNLDTSPTWTFKTYNATPNVMISNVFFGFGEGADYGSAFYNMATYTEYDVPEPESRILTITGLSLVHLRSRPTLPPPPPMSQSPPSARQSN